MPHFKLEYCDKEETPYWYGNAQSHIICRNQKK